SMPPVVASDRPQPLWFKILELSAFLAPAQHADASFLGHTVPTTKFEPVQVEDLCSTEVTFVEMAVGTIMAEECERRLREQNNLGDQFTPRVDQQRVARRFMREENVELLVQETGRTPRHDASPRRRVASRIERAIIDAPQSTNTQTCRHRQHVSIAND